MGRSLCAVHHNPSEREHSMERDGYIAGVPCWVATEHADPDGAVEFYGGLFGWQFENVLPPDAPAKYYIARIRGRDVAAVSLPPEGAPAKGVWDTYVWVESADEATAKAYNAGGAVVVPPFDVGDAGRMAVLADPAGAAIRVWQANQHRGAQIVNEPGSVNFNDLHTPDLEAVKPFYATVFGWETLEVGPGATVWTLPGYGDYLEKGDPGLRERIAELGAPAGFEDAVATVAPPVGDGAPPHWGVTLAVEDADATAKLAAELGGRVLVGPIDAPWVRMTVIADPQGATFTATQFVPENRSVEAGAAAA
jgi:uncharacterized protein